MTPEQENFDGLLRLLKVKRYEQPPPGYFKDFSPHIIAQIKASAPVEREPFLDRLSWEVPWLQRLIETLQAKPALAVSFGAGLCALLLGGVIYSESMEFNRPMPTAEIAPDVTASSMAISPIRPSRPVEAALLLGDTTNSLIPISQPPSSLFDQFHINPQPASFQLRGDKN